VSLDQRSTAILSYLSQAKRYVPSTEISEKFNISRRTIYYDIEKINGWLSENRLPEVKHVRSAGFYLEEEAVQQMPEKLGMIKTWHYEYSVQERKAWLVIYIMTRETSLYLEDLMEKIRVSRNTTIENLKSIKEELLRFHLQLEFDRKLGYVVNGKEEDKRKAIVFYLQLLLPDQSWQTLLAQIPMILNAQDQQIDVFDSEKLKAVRKIVSESEKDLNLQFTDDFLYSLSLRLLLFGRRLAQGKKVQIDVEEKKVLNETKEYSAAKKISSKLSKLFKLEFPEDEIYYITKHLLSSRILFLEEQLDHNSSHDKHVLAKVVSRMVTDFQKYACVFLKNREEVEKSLLLHVKPAYYRVKYGLEVESNVAVSIIEKYADIFRLTKKVIHHLEKAVGKNINDNEIALIAMHFGGWMERVGVKPANRKKALLVCTTGVGTSRLLQHQLEGLFSTVDIVGSVSLREYEKDEYDIDFIISTISIQEKDKPVFVVSPILTEAEKEGLLKKVNALMDTKVQQRTSTEAIMEIVQKYAEIIDEDSLRGELRKYLYQPAVTIKEVSKPSLKDLLKKNHIQVAEKVSGWREAVRLAAEPLVEKGSITEGYVQAMISTLLKMGPYVVVSPKVAIPHARPEDGVNKIGMSLLKLQQSVPFTDKGTHEVKLIIVLAAIDGDTHLKALSQLTNMLSDKKANSQILKMESPESIFNLITTFST
jgi:mannitol operon transcriptional antiterminator